MKQHYIYGLFAAALALGACDYNEDNFPGFDELAQPTHVWNDTITLAKGDYKKIAENKDNIALAKEKDEAGDKYQKALEALADKQCFSEDVPAAWYIPALIAEKYPYMDNKSKVVVYYDSYAALPEYLSKFNGAESYGLEYQDYMTVWGNPVRAAYLTPNTLEKMPEVLKVAKPVAEEGDVLLVNYAFSATEPGLGSNVDKEGFVYKKVTGVKDRGGKFVMLAYDMNNKLIPFGEVKDGAMTGDAVELQDGTVSQEVAAQHYLSVEATANGFTLKNAQGKYVTPATEGNGIALGNEPVAWSFESHVSGGCLLKEQASGKIVKLVDAEGVSSFKLFAAGGSEYFNEPITKDDNGGFEAKDEVNNNGNKAIWEFGSYKDDYYWKGGVNKDNANVSNISWLVSQEIDLTEAAVPVLSFSYAFNYLNTDPNGYLDVYVLENYAGDIAQTDKQKLEGIQWEDPKDWEFVESGNISLSAFSGKKVRLAFRYDNQRKSSFGFEVKNLKIAEQDTYMQLYEEVPAQEITVQNNASALYVFEEGAWKVLSMDDVDLAILQPADYSKLGMSSISKPEQVLPNFLSYMYPYAAAGDVMAAVYLNKDKKVAVDEFKYDGTLWSMTTTAVQNIMTFQKVSGTWIEARFYLDVDFESGEGAFEVKNVDLGGLEKIWTFDKGYGYWKATSYKNGNIPSESYLISPEVDMTKANVPYMTVQMILNHVKDSKREDHVNIKVSENYTGDPATAEWETLDVKTWPAGDSWDSSATEQVSLDKYVGKKVHIAFHYKATTAGAPTWEIEKIYVGE